MNMQLRHIALAVIIASGLDGLRYSAQTEPGLAAGTLPIG